MNYHTSGKLITLGALVLLTGCVSGTDQKKAPQTQKQSVTSQPQKSKTDDQVPEILKKSEGSFSINGIKFKSKSRVLVKGTEVFNTYIKEPGTITGKIVLSLPEGVRPDENPAYVSQPIAKNVHQLQFVSPNTDMMVFYRQFVGKFGQKAVEMGVDYSPISSDRPAY